jgi:hypothetical protein
MMGLVLAAMVGSIDVVPAFARDEHGRYERRERGHERDRRWHDGRDYRPYGYGPPPVIYAPEPSPGITIFFPPIIIR